MDWDFDREFYKVIKRDYFFLTEEEGSKMLEYLGSKYNDVESWEKRRDSVRLEMRHKMGLDNFPEHFNGAVYQMLSAERMMDWLCALPEADLERV